jgi:peptide chain release factor 3
MKCLGSPVLGDTLYAGALVRDPPVPRFPPEHFGRARLLDQRSKQFEAGVTQLEEEGLMQVVFPVHGRREPILGVVGPLQLDIVEARLKQEYGVECKIDPISYVAMRWVKADAKTLSDIENRSSGVLRAVDRDERPVLLFESPWHLTYMQQQNPNLELATLG